MRRVEQGPSGPALFIEVYIDCSKCYFFFALQQQQPDEASSLIIDPCAPHAGHFFGLQRPSFSAPHVSHLNNTIYSSPRFFFIIFDGLPAWCGPVPGFFRGSLSSSPSRTSRHNPGLHGKRPDRSSFCASCTSRTEPDQYETCC